MLKFPLEEMSLRKEFTLWQLQKRVNLLPKLGGHGPDHGPWVAGGAVRRAICGEEQGDDIDIFFSSPYSYDYYMKQVKELPHYVRADTERCTEISFEFHGEPTFIVDFVKTPFDDLDALFEDFDFTCCQFAMDNHYVYAGDLAMLHAGQRVLRANNWSKMKISYAHMVRYMHEGWKPGQPELDALLADVARDGTVMQIASKYSGEHSVERTKERDAQLAASQPTFD